MIILYLLCIPAIYILIKLTLYFIVKKFGKFSYDGLSIAGFSYNPEKDIFYSTMNAWQKNFGYSRLYDVWSPIFRMIFDSEPIKFFYNDKNWLINFWKGQYGIVTGAEIGIYCTKEKMINKNTLYLPIDDSEMLDMGFTLFRKGEEIIKIDARHWWLAAFKLGMFSKPKNLTMRINITFPNQEMLQAFLTSFEKLGYKSKDYKILNNTFFFSFKKPRTRKVYTRNFITDGISQSLNKKNVKLYNKYLSDVIDNNKQDDYNNNDNFIFLGDFVPDILKGTSDNKDITVKTGEKIYNNKNVVFLNNDIYSNLRNNHE